MKYFEANITLKRGITESLDPVTQVHFDADRNAIAFFVGHHEYEWSLDDVENWTMTLVDTEKK